MAHLFVVLEGVDGAGKSTLRDLVFERLEQKGPMCTMMGQYSWLDPTSARIILDMKEQRKYHDPLTLSDAGIKDKLLLSTHFLKPATRYGHTVTDRYIYSDAVYHEVLYGVPAERTLQEHHRLGTTFPDFVVFVDVPAEEAFRRIVQRGEERRFYERLDTLEKLLGVYRRLFLEEVELVNSVVLHFLNDGPDWRERAEVEVLQRVDRLA